jgi:hypothetical protein
MIRWAEVAKEGPKSDSVGRGTWGRRLFEVRTSYSILGSAPALMVSNQLAHISAACVTGNQRHQTGLQTPPCVFQPTM